MRAEKPFELVSEYSPSGDQPEAISALVASVASGEKHQTLLGVTGSGKTYTSANVIEQIGKPTLVLAHNKTLAAQLASEYREFFPNNSVQYFVSYYDYYQPEAYVAISDTYIEKEAQINEEIDRLRHATTQALLTRTDVIVVASVSAIYGLGSPERYEAGLIKISKQDTIGRADMIRRLIYMHFDRTTADLKPGTFRAMGNTLEIHPANEEMTYRVVYEKDRVVLIEHIEPISRQIVGVSDTIYIFPAKHFVTTDEIRDLAVKDIAVELQLQLKTFEAQGKVLEHERLKRRTTQDMAMMREIGYCAGIENYSRHFDRRAPGEAPHTLLSYFPHKEDGSPDFLTVIDESHVTIPQLGGMYAGDRARKDNLVEHGFRLPSAIDNRPLKFAEIEDRLGQRLYVSATPGKYEFEHGGKPVEQVIRPTGLIDPEIDIRPIVSRGKYEGQVRDMIDEAVAVTKAGARTLVTTLTKKMAEDLTDFLKDEGLNARYIHSDVKTIERIEILTDFRRGGFDVLVGVNLLREGLDLPEVELVGILDADKEGFLRSETSLIQTMGRAARNVNGRVILYAEGMTGSMERAVNETNRRRAIQEAYNKEHGITPQSVKKAIADISDQFVKEHTKAVASQLAVDRKIATTPTKMKKLISKKRKEMTQAAKDLDFETAALLRDEIKQLEEELTQ